MPVFSKLCSLSTFPEETLEQIFINFWNLSKSDRAALLSCSLATQQFYRITHPLLFRILRVYGNRNSPQPFAKVTKALKGGVIDTKVVQELELRGVKDSSINYLDLYLLLSACNLQAILSYMPHIRVFKLIGVRMTPCTHDIHIHPPLDQTSSLSYPKAQVLFDGVVLDSFVPTNAQHLTLLSYLRPTILHTACVFSTTSVPFNQVILRIPEVYLRLIDVEWLRMLAGLRGVQNLQLWDISSEHQEYVKAIIGANANTLHTLVIGANLGYSGEAGEWCCSRISNLV